MVWSWNLWRLIPGWGLCVSGRICHFMLLLSISLTSGSLSFQAIMGTELIINLKDSDLARDAGKGRVGSNF